MENENLCASQSAWGFLVCNRGYLSIQMNKQVRSVHKLTYMFPKSPSLAKDLCLVITQSISEKKNWVYCIYIYIYICYYMYMIVYATKVYKSKDGVVGPCLQT